MLVGDLIESARDEHADVAKALTGVVEVLQEVAQPRRARRRPNDRMEFPVDIQDALRVLGLDAGLHVREQRGELGVVGLGQVGRRQPRRQAIEYGTHMVDLDALRLGQLAHHGAPVRRDGHQAGDLQPVERLPDRHPTNPKLFGKFVRDEPLPRRVASRKDTVSNRVIRDLLHGPIFFWHKVSRENWILYPLSTL